MKNNQQGFSVVELFIIVLVIALGAFVGWRVYSGRKVLTTNSTTTKTVQSTVPAKISNKTDVKNASSALDATNVDASLNPNQLDAGIASLL